MPKASPTISHKICEAALQLTAKQPWASLTLDQIAKAAKVSATEAKKIFKTTNDILPAIVSYVEAKTIKAAGKLDARATPHDRLFEVMMARFDTLQIHRAGILNIAKAIRQNPALLQHLLPAEFQVMNAMLACANINLPGLQQIFAATGLLAVYGLVLCVWQKDETGDMARTMAALDRHLRRSGKLAELVFLQRKPL